jgi:large subunit ribosomal protein L7Ae
MPKSTQQKKPKKEIKSFVFRSLKPSNKIGSGGVLPKSKALGRLIRWPKYVKLQRQKKILFQRLKIPPAINIFSEACGKPFAKSLVTFFLKYSPETKKQKKRSFTSMGQVTS